jgi:hypothetical protein
MSAPVITQNTPPGGITWTAFHMVYQGVDTLVSAGSTTLKFTWWRYNGGAPVVESGPDIPTTFDWVNDCLLFLNKGGIGLCAINTTVVEGSLIVNDSILANSIGANQIQAKQLAADAVVAGKINADAISARELQAGSVNTSELVAGAVTADRLSAGAVTADKLGIGAYTSNLALNPYFEELDPADNTWVTCWTKVTGTGYVGAGYALETATPISGGRSIKLTASAGNSAAVIGKQVPVTPTEDFYFSAAIRGTSPSSQTAAIGVWYYNASGTFVSGAQKTSDVTTGVTFIQYTGVVPVGIAYAVPVLLTTATAAVYWDNVEVGHRVTTVKIADGAVDALQIKALAVKAGKIDADAVDTLQLKADSVVTSKILAGNITANKLSAGAVTADKLGIGSYTSNIALNPYFEELDPADSTWVTCWTRVTSPPNTGYTGAVYALETASQISGTRSLKMTASAGQRALVYGQYVPCRYGEDFYASALVYASAASLQTLGIGVWFFDVNKNFLAEDYDIGDCTTTPNYIQYTGVIPTGALYCAPVLLTTSTATTYWDNVEMGHRITTVKIADGAVTAQQVKALTITANEIAGKTITANEIALNTLTADQISTNYIYAGDIDAKQIHTGSISFGLGIAAKLRTPGPEGSPGVEFDQTGIKIIGTTDDTTTTLQPGLSVFKGSAEVSTLTVKGDSTGASATLRQNSEISRGAKLTMSNGVTAPSSAPVPTVDNQAIALSGIDLTGQTPIDLSWDAANNRWLVSMVYSAQGTTSASILPFNAAGVYISGGASVGYGKNGGTTQTILSAVRGPTGNWYLMRISGSIWLSRVADNQLSAQVLLRARNSNSVFSMDWDGTSVVIGEYWNNNLSDQIELTRYNDGFSSGSSLVSNGDFEANITGWSKTGAGAIAWSSATPITGLGSMLVTASASGSTTITGTKFAVTPRQMYNFSLKVRASVAVPTFLLELVYYTVGGVEIERGQSSSNLLAANTQTISGSGTAPINATQAAISFTCSTATQTTTYQIDTVTSNTPAAINYVGIDQLFMNLGVSPVNSLYVGSGDFGAKHYIVGTTNGNMARVCSDATKTEDLNKDFPLPSQTPAGMDYGGDGNFWTLATNLTLYKHEGGNVLGAQTQTWKATSTYRDATPHETPMSNPVTFTMSNRARLTLATTPLLITGSGDPTQMPLYLTKVTNPTRTDYHFQGVSTLGIPVTGVALPPITTPNFSSAPPLDPTITANQFLASSPALLQSSAADGGGANPIIKLGGDGSGRLGQASWNSAGTMTVDSPTFTGTPAFTGTPTAPTAAAGTSTTQLATTAFVTAAVTIAAPSGSIVMWPGASTTIPSGWFQCAGGTLQISTYTNLYNALGGSLSPYGVNVAGGTFNLPNLTSQFIQGVPFGTTNAGATGGQATSPTHGHTLANHSHLFDHTHNAITAPAWTGSTGGTLSATADGNHNHALDLTNSAGTTSTVSRGSGTSTAGTTPIAAAPTHTHPVSGRTASPNGGAGTDGPSNNSTGASGSGTTPDENRPPFVSLHYIIKA